GLAERPPPVIPAGRHFGLPKNAAWSDGNALTAVDVRDTVALLRKGRAKATGRPTAWGEVLQPVVVRAPYDLDLLLTQGYLDQLALMSFKVLPPGARVENKGLVGVDSKEFAENPVGSGPYRLVGRRTDPGTGRPYVGFVANPAFGQRLNRSGLPHIREVRF